MYYIIISIYTIYLCTSTIYIAYYILSGTIYQSPELLELLRTKIWKANTHMMESYTIILQEMNENNENNGNELDVRNSNSGSISVGSSSSASVNYFRETPHFDNITDDIDAYVNI